MRLLFVDFTLPYLLADEEFPVGGWAVQLEQWLLGLSEIGVNAGVLTWKGANAHVKRELPFELLETYDPCAGIRVAKYFYSYIPALLKAARAFRPDAIVQSTRSVHTGIMAFIAERLDVPFIYRVASDADVDRRSHAQLGPLAHLAYDRGLMAADMFVCQNGYQIGQMKLRSPETRLLLLHNAIRTSADVASVHPRADRGYIAWLGVFRKEKNMPLLLRVVKSLPQIEFRIAGGPASNADDETLAAVGALKELPNVHFTSYLKRNQVPGFLADSTALLCTSHYEGFSNTFLEAFAAGTPVLTRKGVDPDTIIERNMLGRVAANDDDLIASALALSQLEADAFNMLSQRCRTYVETSHDPRVSMQRFVQSVRSLIDERSAHKNVSTDRMR